MPRKTKSFFGIAFIVFLLFSKTVLGMEEASDTIQHLNALQQPLIVSQDEEKITRFMYGELSEQLNSDDTVLHYITENPSLFGITNAKEQVKLENKHTDDLGKTHYMYQQQLENVPVYGAYVQLHLDNSGKVYSVQNNAQSDLEDLQLDTRPSLTSDQAIAVLKTALEEELDKEITFGGKLLGKNLPSPQAELVVYPFDGEYYLTYAVSASYADPSLQSWTAFVDAHNGNIINMFNNVRKHSATTGYGIDLDGNTNDGVTKELNVYHDHARDQYLLVDTTKDMYNESNFSGVIQTLAYQYNTAEATTVTSTVYDGFTDNHAIDAHYYAGQVYDFYRNSFDRLSYDNEGSDIISIVHYTEDGSSYANAFWIGEGFDMMVYGDGGDNFKCMSCANDIVAHEITHAVIEHTAELVYEGQSGALDESFADIFAAILDAEDWTIGEDSGTIIRSLEDPTRYSQPKHMDQYYVTDEDNGGVHTNSGIPNYAAYLIAEGIDQLDNPMLDGRDILGKLAYTALNKYLFSTADFENARDAYVLAALDVADELGLTTEETNQLRDVVISAWSDVGLSYPELSLVSSSPSDSSTSVQIDDPIILTFNHSVVEDVYFNDIELLTSEQTVATSISIEDEVLTIRPTNYLDYSTSYELVVPAQAVQDYTGYTSLASEISISFTTESKSSSSSSGGGGSGGGGGGSSSQSVVTNSIIRENDTIVIRSTLNESYILQKLNTESTDQLIIDTSHSSYDGQLIVNMTTNVLNQAAKKNTALNLLGNDGNLFIPAGAIQEDTGKSVQFKLSQLQPSEYADFFEGAVKVSPVFDFSLTVDEEEAETFNKPLKITLHLDKETYQNADNLGVYFYNADDESWEYIGGDVVEDGQSIRFETDHFSQYTVLEFERPLETKTFDDIQGHWAQSAIEQMAAEGIVSGITDHLFAPNKQITRAEFVALLVRALDIQIPEPKAAEDIQFKDVPAGAWYEEAIVKAYSIGVIGGLGDFTIEPNQEINREQMAAMIMRTYAYTQGVEESSLDSVPLATKDADQVSDWAKKSVELAYQYELMTGYPDGSFAPLSNTTRAEAVIVIQNLMHLIEGN